MGGWGVAASGSGLGDKFSAVLLRTGTSLGA